MALTAKQEKFVQGLISGLSQRKAYRAAYPNAQKWSDNTVDVKACHVFAEPKIQARFEELRARAADEAVLTLTQRMITLSEIAKDADEKTEARIKAIDTLNKMDGAYTNKIEISKPVDESIQEMEAYFADKEEGA